MRAPRLLAEGKHRPDQEGNGERDPGEPRPRIHPDEVERHEREAGRGMRAGEAGGARQAVGAVLEQVNVGTRTAEARKVARAVHVRRKLQEVDDRWTERKRDRDKSGGTAPRPQRRNPETADEGKYGGEPDSPHERRADAVYQWLSPPGFRADPRRGARVEEERLRDAPVEVERVDGRGRGEEERRRHAHVRQPGAGASPGRRLGAVAVHQKLRFVWMRNCTLSIDGSPSSGKATSKWMTLPRAERVLPRRSPKPTSFSSPRSSLGPNGVSP